MSKQHFKPNYTYADYYLAGKKFLVESKSFNHNLVVQLLELASGKSQKQIYEQWNRKANFPDSCFWEMIHKYKSGVPLGQLTNHVFFLEKFFWTNFHVFTPRSETEQLVQITTNYLNHHKNLRVLEIGTGTGVIVNSLLMLTKNQNHSYWANDQSPHAIDLAFKNCQFHFSKNFANKIHFETGSFWEPWDKKYDVIVSNPPYVSPSDEIDIYARYDPPAALYAESDGMAFYERLFKSLRSHVKPKWALFLEIGSTQKGKLEDLIKRFLGLCDYNFIKDGSGHWRILQITHD